MKKLEIFIAGFFIFSVIAIISFKRECIIDGAFAFFVAGYCYVRVWKELK